MNYPPQNPKKYNWPSRQQVQKAGVKTREFIEDNTALSLMLAGVLCILIAISLRVIAVNIEPYLIVMGEQPFVPTRFPLIGWGIDIILMFFTRTGAFIAWALIFLFEAAGILIGLNKFVYRAAVKESLDEQKRQSTVHGQMPDRVDRYVRKMTKKAKRLPFAPIYLSFGLATVAYLFEILLQLRAYPLVKKPDQFFADLMAGNPMPISLDNVLRIAWNTIATELILILIVCVWMALQQSRAGEKL